MTFGPVAGLVLPGVSGHVGRAIPLALRRDHVEACTLSRCPPSAGTRLLLRRWLWYVKLNLMWDRY